MGWVYRKDWFARPELQAEFKEKHGRDLAPPKNWNELKDIAEFLQPYVEAGCETLNLTMCAETVEAAIEGAGEVKQLLVEALGPSA